MRGEQSGGGRAVERQRSRMQLRVSSAGCVSLSCCSAHGCHRRNDCSRMGGGVGAEGGGQQRRGGAHRRSAATSQQRRHMRSRCSSGHRHSGNRSSSGGRGRRSIDGVGCRITETSHAAQSNGHSVSHRLSTLNQCNLQCPSAPIDQPHVRLFFLHFNFLQHPSRLLMQLRVGETGSRWLARRSAANAAAGAHRCTRPESAAV